MWIQYNRVRQYICNRFDPSPIPQVRFNIVTNLKSPYKLIFFDNDGTLNTDRSTWEYFHKHLGTWEEGRPIMEHHLEARTPYDEFSRISTRLWKGFHKEKFMERLRTVKIRPGAPALIRDLKAAGLKLVVLSSGISLWRQTWWEREGIDWDHYHANDIVFDEDGICTGEIEMHVTDNVPGMDKGSWVERISEEESIPIEERVFIGDGWGDVSGFRKCAFGIGVDPNMQEVIDSAKYVLYGDDFLKIKDLLLTVHQP